MPTWPVDMIEVANDLVALLGPDQVVSDLDVIASHSSDWTGRFRGHAPVMLRPVRVEDVAIALRWCNEHRIGVVTQGGNTGLVGGATPYGHVLLSTLGLRATYPVDESAGQVTVRAGVTLGQLQRHLHGSGWDFGIDLASRDTATIGGMVATNAGGTRVLRYGMMRSQVRGLQAVLTDGSVVSHLAGMEKDNTGYHLDGLLCGSEGTLGVITEVRLALVPTTSSRVTAQVGCLDWSDAVTLSTALRRQVRHLDAIEAVTASGIALVRDELGVSVPLDAPILMIVEVASNGDACDDLIRVIGDRPNVVAMDSVGRARLWQVRERQTEAINRRGPPHKLDVTVPVAVLASFCEEVVHRVTRCCPGASVHLFGHLGDGNIHVNISGVSPDDELVDEAVFSLVRLHDGSISAEHGIGRAKAKWLPRQRSAAELGAMRAIKDALDPHGILNPGVIFDQTLMNGRQGRSGSSAKRESSG